MSSLPGRLVGPSKSKLVRRSREITSQALHRDRDSLVGRAASAITSTRGGVLFAASALAAAAWHEMENRRVTSADFDSVPVRVVRLNELRDDAESLDAIEAGLRNEWGEFALLGFDSLRQLAAKAGNTVLVALVEEDGRFVPKAALQTTVGNFRGDPSRLHTKFDSFQSLTSAAALTKASRHGGDTAVFLQITVFGKDDRGLGLGTLLRDAGLNLVEDRVKYAITTTPIDRLPERPPLDLEDTNTFTAAMRFHARGGAAPVLVLPAFKRTEQSGASTHGSDIVVMRYVRDEDGAWPVAMPAMHFKRVGPLQAKIASTARGLRALPQNSMRLLPHHTPAASEHTPEASEVTPV
jgi:hypothetical protein